ncbi:hypothetical protein C8A05DRAFT_11348, partial [Staphylotrichum tortipilum]
MSAPPPVGGFSLFPNPNNDPRPPSRSQSRPRAATPQEGPPAANSFDQTPPRASRVRRNSSVREGKNRAVSNNPWQHALDATAQERQQQQQQQHQPQPFGDNSGTAGPSTAPAAPAPAVPLAAADPVVETTHSQPVTDAPQRCDTAFSEAQTLVRSSSQRSRSSIAKPPIAYTTAGPSSSAAQPAGAAFGAAGPAPIRSIFPRYNPEIPLARQDYYPTQASPTHIPQSAISRPLYSPPIPAPSSNGPIGVAHGTPVGAASAPSHAHAAASAPRWPRALGQRHHEPTAIPSVSTTEELRDLWKATNGWRASSSEGRSYCLRMATSPDLPPSYTLSSASGQPFYCLRVDPTSSSALVTLSRYDPNKPFKAASSTSGASAATIAIASTSGGASSPSPRASSSSRQSNHPATNIAAHTPATTSPKHQKYWQEVLATHLSSLPTTTTSPPQGAEDETDPDTGLLAHLWPSAAARLVADRANDATTVALAQGESARLVWDADSASHFLVHPALAVPFCVTVERTPAFARTEYVLEHLESPAHLARLVRDGTGAGWLEVDTGIAGKVEAVYLVDVAVAALVIVAHLDGGV